MQLRLFCEHETPTVTNLRTAFIADLLPRLERANRAPGTIAKYWRALQHWEAITDDPAITDVSSQLLDAFPERLIQSGRVRTNTAANQQQCLVGAILKRALERPPEWQPLARESPASFTRLIPAQDLARIYAACKYAQWTTDSRLPAPLVWRTLLVLLINAACRRCEAVLMPATALRRESRYPRLRHDDIFKEVENPGGWLVFHTPKTQRVKNGLPQVLPVTALLRQHLDRLDQYALGRARLLPLGEHATTWRKEFNRIQARAGIAQFYTFQDCRLTANWFYRRLANRDVAEFMLGHSPRGVNATFYDDLTRDAAEAVAQFPQPFEADL